MFHVKVNILSLVNAIIKLLSGALPIGGLYCLLLNAVLLGLIYRLFMRCQGSTEKVVGTCLALSSHLEGKPPSIPEFSW